jgi:hypothetical protein
MPDGSRLQHHQNPPPQGFFYTSGVPWKMSVPSLQIISNECPNYTEDKRYFNI